MTSRPRLRAVLLCMALITQVVSAQTTTPGRLATGVSPIYPLEAKAAGREGHLLLKATIAADGTVHNLRVVFGPAEFRQAALRAAAQWKYHSYYLDGKPVAFETTINVNFLLGNKKEKAEAIAQAQAELAQAAANAAKPEPTSPSDPAAPPATSPPQLH